MAPRGLVRKPQQFYSRDDAGGIGNATMRILGKSPLVEHRLSAADRKEFLAAVAEEIDRRAMPKGMEGLFGGEEGLLARKEDLNGKMESLAERVNAAYPDKPEYVVFACWLAARKITLIAPSILEAVEKMAGSEKEFRALMGVLDKAWKLQAADLRMHMRDCLLELVGAIGEFHLNGAPKLQIAKEDMEAIRAYYLKPDVEDRNETQ